MLLVDWARAPVVFVLFEGDRHRYARFDAQHWLEQIGDSWERVLNPEEHETAYRRGTEGTDAPA